MSGIRPGDVIAGKFRVEHMLGEGGMGYVVAARHLQLGQIVALKFMREEVCTSDYRSRFLREARNTVRLKSKHVSRVLDVGALDNGTPYMVMEYLEGIDLSALLHERGSILASEACEYVLQACEAIAEAHGHGIIHRDLKPANLFLTRGQSGEPIVKVLDFGVSKVLDLASDDDTNPGGRPHHVRPGSVVTKASDLLGSPGYMAPEQIVSARNADARSDLWSLGVILFRLISGKAPFNGTSLGDLLQAIIHAPIPSLREVWPSLPNDLEYVVSRCLERDRNRRIGDASELARLLAPYAGPVATPSLERIAVLGPALVTSMTSAPSERAAPPRAFNSGSRAPTSHSPRSAWTAPPNHALLPREAQRRDLTATSAAMWAALFVLFVAVTAIVVAKIAGKRHDPPPDPGQGVSPLSESMSGIPSSNLALGGAAPDPSPSALGSERPASSQGSVGNRARARGGSAARGQAASPSASPPNFSGDPASRE